MPRRNRHYVFAAVVCLILAGQSEQGWSADHHQHQEQAAANPTPGPQSPDPKATDQTDKHCYGASQPRLSCDAISAQAAVDQARDADKQAAAVWWQFGVGALTLAAAVAAAIFAWLAAHHTKRSADTAGQGLESTRTWIVISIEADFIELNDTAIRQGHRLTFRNVGQTVAHSFKSVHRTIYRMPSWEELDDIWNRDAIHFKGNQKSVIVPGGEHVFRGGGEASRDLIDWRLDKTIGRYAQIVIIVSAFYKTKFDNNWHRTDAAFIMGGSTAGGEGPLFLDEVGRWDGKEVWAAVHRSNWAT